MTCLGHYQSFIYHLLPVNVEMTADRCTYKEKKVGQWKWNGEKDKTFPSFILSIVTKNICEFGLRI